VSALRIKTLPAAILVALTSSGATAAAPWVADEWQYRVPITVDPTMISGTESLDDFPLLVMLRTPSQADAFAGAKSDGSDLLVTAADGVTVVEREVAEYDSASGFAEIWVRAPSLSPSDREFFLYYGNPDTTLALAPATAWKPEYKAVYHFADDPGAGVLSDSSPAEVDANLDPARLWTAGDVTDGQIGQAWLFNGDTHHVASFMSTQDSSYVMSAWLMNTNRSTDFFLHAQPGFWHTSAQVNDASQQPDYVRQGATVRFFPNPIPINDGYHHFAWVFNHAAQTVDFYFDGVAQAVHSTVPSNLQTLYIGQAINPDGNLIVGILGPRIFNTHDLMTGGGDEYRLHEGVLSGDWILTEVRNQSDHDSYIAVGAQEQQMVTATRRPLQQTRLWARAAPNPFGGRTSIEFALPRPGPVELTIHNVAGRTVARLEGGSLPAGRHVRHWNGKSDSGEAVAAGVYFLRLRAGGSSTAAKLLLMQ